ncbi:Spo0B domain-containing protein [Exiguobacterium sp. UBA3968]|uniref:Spo0B domain-containing protein n=1 Tax=Exiguobacterium sp. UBA3968 TaxID=1946492 RepID=UPI0025B94BCD|nr:Spo0B domain-containing protein [Exiguobacterium sp. UBA3968]
MEEQQVLDLLKTLRHEWLNRIQLVRSYGAIGDEQAVESICSAYREQASREGRLAQIGLPKTALALLQAEWSGKTVTYDVIGAPHMEDERLKQLVEAAITMIDVGVGEVSVTFHEGVTIEIYRDLLDMSRLKDLVTPMEIESQTENECVIEIESLSFEEEK